MRGGGKNLLSAGKSPILIVSQKKMFDCGFIKHICPPIPLLLNSEIGKPL